MTTIARDDLRQASRLRRRRDDRWIALTALAAAVISLPFAQTQAHAAEAAAILAVAATALLAGQRWAIAVVVIAELALLPAAWPRAFVWPPEVLPRAAGLVALAALVPGLLAIRRAAAALVIVGGWKRTRVACRRMHAGLVVLGIALAALPLIH
ncbi:MAG TPA: hypothetical protein VGM88_17500 [Kofleriaceae bacterium]|jgi:hypothetical protein